MLHAFKCVLDLLCCDSFGQKKDVVVYGMNIILCMRKTSTYRIFVELYGERSLEDKFLSGRILELILGIHLLIVFCCGYDEHWAVSCFLY
jgi:hypothetical protein